LIVVVGFTTGRDRILTVVGAGAATGIVLLTASSTPLFSGCAVAAAGAMYFWRRWIPVLLGGSLVTMVALHVTMTKPIWHLFARVNAIGGSTGWHRFHLIDETINHFGDWWVCGTKETASWGQGLADITNEYVLHVVDGGLLSGVLFLAIIITALYYIWRKCESSSFSSRKRVVVWAIGTSVIAHCVSFLGTSYFGQIGVIWWLSLALTASIDEMSEGDLPEQTLDPQLSDQV
jgi:hypothetical protein